MKRAWAVVFAAWTLEHLLHGPRTEALCGDLLEEVQSGRSAFWLWRQVASAVATGAWSAAKCRVPLLVFCVGWTMLYPVWHSVSGWITPAHLGPWTALSWPVPAILEIVCGVLPAMAFLWIGCVVFALLRNRSIPDSLFARSLAGMSPSLHVLLPSILWLLYRYGQPRPDLTFLTREDFYFPFHLFPISLPLAASLFAALRRTHETTPRVARRRRIPQRLVSGKAARAMQTWGLGIVLATSCAAQTGRVQDAPSRGTDAELVAALQKKLDDATKADRFSGAVMLAKNGHPIFARAYGLADRDKDIPNSLNTRFRIGSMSKMFTAVAVLQLAEANKIRLDDPVGRYLAGYPNKKLATEVTIDDLLDNSGGTGDVVNAPGHHGLLSPDFLAHRAQLRTIGDYIRLYGDRAPDFKPGSRFEYSNFGFILLGAVIEKVSGENYYEYVRKHIYDPAGMHSSGSEPEDRKIPNLSIGYTRYGTGHLHPDTDTLPYRGAPDGGSYSTVHDLLAFAAALRNHRLLDAHYTELLTTGKIDMPVNGRYAYGFMDHRSAGVQCVGHAGAWPGTNSDFEMCLDSRYAYAVLSNMDPPSAQQIGFFIGNWVTKWAATR